MSADDSPPPERGPWRTELVEETRRIRARRRADPNRSHPARTLAASRLFGPVDVGEALHALTALRTDELEPTGAEAEPEARAEGGEAEPDAGAKGGEAEPGARAEGGADLRAEGGQAEPDAGAKGGQAEPEARAEGAEAESGPAVGGAQGQRARRADASRGAPSSRLRAREDAAREAEARARLWTSAPAGERERPPRAPPSPELPSPEDEAARRARRRAAPETPDSDRPAAPKPRRPPPGPAALAPTRPAALAWSAPDDGTELDVRTFGGAPPTDDVIGLPTSGIPVELRRQAILLEHIPELSADALRPLAGALPPAELSSLDEVLGGAHESPDRDAAVSPKRALEHLVHEGGLDRLDPDEQGSLLAPVARDPTDVSAPKAALALLRSGALFELTVADRKMACQLFGALDPEGRVRLAQVAARRLGARSALGDRADDDLDLATHLFALLRALGPERARDALGPLSHPAGIAAEEGESGVALALEHLLAETWPAEHARLSRQLAIGRRGARLSSGAPLSAADGPPETPLWAHLRNLPPIALPGRRARPARFVMGEGPALDAEVIAASLEQLFGIPYALLVDPGLIGRRLSELSVEAPGRPPTVLGLRTDTGERLFRFVDTSDSGVQVTSPRGRRGGVGLIRLDPPRRALDPDTGRDEIPHDIFDERIGAAFLPKRRT